VDDAPGTGPLVVVVMGVAGCGKTTVGEALSARLGCRFIEGDAYHSAANREKMAAGVPLTDDDRWPWLDALAAELAGHARAGESAVLACSALRRAYRDRLRRGCPDLKLVFLTGDASVISQRLSARQGHYMPSSLLASQLQTLEPPDAGEGAIVADVALETPQVVRQILRALLSPTRCS